jgi:hypothetical protein
MNTSRTAASLRAFCKPLTTAALVLMLLFSVLASASPSLHHWAHADDRAPSHYCVITALEHGHTDVTSVWVAIPMPVSQASVAALPRESFFVSHDTKLFPERGPPALS